jgi:hypothetical protein
MAARRRAATYWSLSTVVFHVLQQAVTHRAAQAAGGSSPVDIHRAVTHHQQPGCHVTVDGGEVAMKPLPLRPPRPEKKIRNMRNASQQRVTILRISIISNETGSHT